MADTKTRFIFEGDGSSVAQMLERTTEKVENLERRFSKMGRQSKKTGKSAHNDLLKMAAGVVSVTAVVGAARRAFGMWKEDIADIATVARAAQEDLLDLLFMGKNVSDPKFLTRITGEARRARVPIPRYGRAKEAFLSMTMGIDPKKQAAIWREAVEHKQTTAVPLQEVATIYAKVATLYPDLTPQQIQNFVQVTRVQAAATFPDLAGAIPGALTAGRLGKLSPKRLSAIFAAATQATKAPDVAATAMMAMAAGAMFGKGKATKRMLRRVGITEDMDMMDRLRLIQKGREAGKVSDEMIFKLFGRRGMRAGLPLTEPGRDLFAPHLAAYERVRGKDSVKDLLGEAVTNQPWYVNMMKMRGAEARIEGAKVTDIDTQRIWLVRAQLEAWMRERGYGAVRRWAATAQYDVYTALDLAGAGPEDAAYRAAPAGVFKRPDEFTRELRTAIEELNEAATRLNSASGAVEAKSKSENRSLPGGSE